jgi:hypothetical protein
MAREVGLAWTGSPENLRRTGGKLPGKGALLGFQIFAAKCF